MAEPQPQPPIRARSAGALPHRDLDRLDVDELERLYAFLEHTRDTLVGLDVQRSLIARVDVLDRAVDAALVTIYRRIGFRRRADRILPPPPGAGLEAHPGLRSGDVYHGVGFVGPVCESPTCPAPHDQYGRHPAGMSI